MAPAHYGKFVAYFRVSTDPPGKFLIQQRDRQIELPSLAAFL